MTTDGFSTAAPEQPASSLPPFRVFLLSPANLSGERAAMIFNPGAQFEVAVRLRSAAGASVGDVFAFVSGLYFRGKRAYANAFGRPPESLASAFVISPAEGLRPLEEHVSMDRLGAWADVEIDAGNAAFTRPLFKHAETLERAHGSNTCIHRSRRHESRVAPAAGRARQPGIGLRARRGFPPEHARHGRHPPRSALRLRATNGSGPTESSGDRGRVPALAHGRRGRALHGPVPRGHTRIPGSSTLKKGWIPRGRSEH